MNRESFYIGEKEFAASMIAPFAANGILLKLQKIILPVLGGVAGDSKKQINIMEMDISAALEILSERLDEKVMTDIVLPMFKLAQVASVTDNIKLDSSQNIDKVFVDANGLADLYQLIFDVLKYNFSGFFVKVAERFGGSVGTPPDQKLTSAASGN